MTFLMLCLGSFLFFVYIFIICFWFVVTIRFMNIDLYTCGLFRAANHKFECILKSLYFYSLPPTFYVFDMIFYIF